MGLCVVRVLLLLQLRTVPVLKISTREMNAGVAVVVDKAELIKWCDALDELAGSLRPIDVVKGLQMARECQHPNAVWLSSLFPSGAEATQQRMCEVMLQQGDDPRAMWLAWVFGGRRRDGNELLRGAAQRGYAPAQAALASHTGDHAERLQLLEKAAALDERNALFSLGRWWKLQQSGREKETELLRRAAELNHRQAQFEYGRLAFGYTDWERYVWWGRAALHHCDRELGRSVLRLLPSFEEGKNGRILHVIAPLVKSNIDFGKRIVLGKTYDVDQMGRFQRVIELFGVMMSRARASIDCWSMAGRRLRVVKDMRVVIAKMAWAEVWRWGEKEEDARVERRARRG
jgi:hypothetical protein